MAINTRGFALSALPTAPKIPTNIGHIDVGEIYNNVMRGLQTGDAISSAPLRKAQEQTDRELAIKTALAKSSLVPSETSLALAQNQAGEAQAPIGTQVAGLNRDALASKIPVVQQDNRNALARGAFIGGLPIENQVALDVTHALPTAEKSDVTRDAAGNIKSTGTKSVTVGDKVVPVATEESSSPAAQITQLSNGAGFPSGNIITTVGPDGKQQVHVAQAPIGALNNVVAGSRFVKVGTRNDEQGNPKDIIQQQTHSATSNEWVNHGAAIERAGTGATVGSVLGDSAGGGAEAVQPFMSKDALKAIDDAQTEVQGLNTRKLELQNITNAAEGWIRDGVGAGRFVGPVREFLGDSKAQEFVGSVQNALSTALQPLRGTGRVSNTEFNQALSALPKVTDQAETIRSKLDYLNLITDWSLARQQSYIDELGQGLNRYQAFRKAEKDTPLPSVPDFYSIRARGEVPVRQQFGPGQAQAPADAPASDLEARLSKYK